MGDTKVMKHGLALLALMGTVGIAHAFTPLAGPSATTYQLNPAHDGTATFDPPSTGHFGEIWRYAIAGTAGYPLIADGRVFVAWSDQPGSTYGQHLVALDEATGAPLWGPIALPDGNFVGLAYDAGRVFAVDFAGLLQAFDAATGDLDWSVQLPGQWLFTSSPSATLGVVYVGGAGSAGTVYALDASTGALLWTQEVWNGDDSSPAIADGDVFVSYVCPQVYSLDMGSGATNWHFSGPCEGGGGATPAVRDHRLYVRDWPSTPSGYVFDSDTGVVLNRIDMQTTPAIGATDGYFLQSGTLRGVRLDDLSVLWSFAGDGQLGTAPIVVDGFVFIGSETGMLYALDVATGHVRFSANTGASIAPTTDGFSMMSSLSAGDGLVLVPTVAAIVAYGEVPDAIFADGFESP